MSGLPSLRLTRQPDLTSVCSTINEYIATSTVNFRTAAQTVDEWVDEWAAQHDRYPWLTAEVDGDFAGCAYAAPWKSRNAYDWTVESTIYLTSAARGRGVGRQLYDALIAVLAAQGFRSAVAVIGLPNEASVGLHERCGYRHAGTIADAGYKMDDWHDVGFWQRRLMAHDAVPGEILSVADAVQASNALAISR